MKIKYKNLIFLSFLIFVLYQFPVFSILGGGSGKKNDPYRIYTIEHLKELADSIGKYYTNSAGNNFSTNKYFILMNDITDSLRIVIGSHIHKDGAHHYGYFYGHYFQGNFDGQGHTITLAIKDSNDCPKALFAGVKNASISNLAVTGYVIAANPMIDTSFKEHYGQYNVGGIFGGSTGDSNKITNCLNSAEIISERIGERSYVGGIGGIANKVIFEKCINIGTIKNFTNVDDTISGICCATGGIVGMINYLLLTKDKSSINNCINSGFIEGEEFVGGIVGAVIEVRLQPLSRISVSNCISTGIVKGNTKWGCIVGENQGGTIINCHYDKQMCGGGE